MLALSALLLAPLVWAAPACRDTGPCDPGGPTNCVARCGGPTVEQACGSCPEGLLDGDHQVTCVEACDGPVAYEGCDHCPDGLIEVTGGPWSCVESCGGPVVSVACDDRGCPSGTFSDDLCPDCGGPVSYCVWSCGSPDDFQLSCGPCSEIDFDPEVVYVDRSTCADAGTDAG
jgi:hypothetical protein